MPMIVGTNSLLRTASLLFAGSLLLGAACQAPDPAPEAPQEHAYRWPPRVIYNTDGGWVYNYLPRRNPDDLNIILNALEGTSVDVVTVLVGIDDDISWRGSPHAELFGDATEVWDPDEDPNRAADGGLTMSAVELLHQNMVAVIEDGHDLLEINIRRGHELGLGMYVSFRMNDAHASDEARCWNQRSGQKKKRPDLLIGSPTSVRVAGADQWNFCWQWNYAKAEVRERFLGLFDETLKRYDFDGVELDFCRGPLFFKPGEVFKNIPTLTEFVRKAQEIVRRHQQERGKPIKLIARVPTSIDRSLEVGMDTAKWIEEGLVDLVVVASPYYATLKMDVERAVELAKESGVLVYAGFDSATYTTSPQGGYERHPETVMRAVALNGYRQGATGIHVFNHDYASHRQRPVPEEEEVVAVSADKRAGRFTRKNLKTLVDLGDPRALATLDRCYYLDSRGTHVDHGIQVPRKLAVLGRGAGAGHAMSLEINDDIAAGLAEGRIKKTELRLRLTDHENSMDRIRCELNGQKIDLGSAHKISNSSDQEWLVIDNPRVRRGENIILVILEGLKTPDPWPTLQQVEVIIKCEAEG